MASSSPRRSAGAKTENTPLLSYSSILILSGFLIGLVASRAVERRWEPLIFLIGLFGLVSWFALGHLSRRREERRQQESIQLAASRLGSRLDRHTLKCQSNAEITAQWSLPRMEQQYLPVMTHRSGPAYISRSAALSRYKV